MTVALHHEAIGIHPERVSKIKPYTETYNWEGIKFPTPSNQWNKFAKQNLNVALNVLYIEWKEIKQAYISKFNSTRKKCVYLLIIEDRRKKHYVAIKRLSALLRGLTSSHNWYFYCRNCLNSFYNENVLKLHVEVCKDHDYCHAKMPEEGKNILKYNSGEKAIRVPFVMYGDMECILEPISGCDSDSEKPFTQDINEHVPCGVGLFTKYAHGEFDKAMKQYRGQDCVEVFVKTLKEQVYRAIRYKKCKMDALTQKEVKIYKEAEKFHICMKMFKKDSKEVSDRKV